MGIIIAISYIFIILVVYTILRFVEPDEDFGLHMMYSMFWPLVAVAIIIAGPFCLIDTLVKKSKRKNGNKRL